MHTPTRNANSVVFAGTCSQKLAFSDDEDSHKEEPPPRKDSRTQLVGKEEKRPVEPLEVKHPVRLSQDARERGGPIEHRYDRHRLSRALAKHDMHSLGL